MHRILGLDAGGSNTRIIAAEFSGGKPHVLGKAELGPGNFRQVGRAGITALLREAVQVCNIDSPADWSVLGGFAGAGTEQSQRDIGEIFSAAGFPGARIHITNDADLLLDAIGEGIVLIAGTGSVCMGRCDRDRNGDRTANDREVRSGGYGYRMPSEVGGYFLGIQAIDIALHMADGRDSGKSCLRNLVMDHLGIASPVEITPLLYPQVGAAQVQERVAALAPAVLQAAAAGDAAAGALVRMTVDGLVDHLLGVYSRLGIKAPVVGLHGGLFAGTHGAELLIDPLRNHELLRELPLRFLNLGLSPSDPDPLLAAMARCVDVGLPPEGE